VWLLSLQAVSGGDVSEDPDQIIQEVGNRAAELRRGLGLSQTDLAQKLGVTFQTVQSMERGRNLTIRTMVKLASALGVSILDLLEVPAVQKSRRLPTGKR
jgi:transcriptional regulator with XRE-family HTH domain